ncbi:beta-ketoacyl-[acyl-carrier-protein] synthase family protein [Natrialbaceae archaeon A-gly3]
MGSGLAADGDVVVTGIGAVTSLGETADRTWDALCAGDSGAGPITRFDPEEAGVRSQVACEVGSGPDDDRVDDRSMGRYAEFAVAAAAEAIEDAGFDPATPGWDPERVGTSIASALGGFPEIEAAAGTRPSPRFLITALANLAAGHVSMCFDARGPNRTPATACAAGTHAIADAVADIQCGRADVVLAGGAEAPISPLGVGSFGTMRALSTRNDDPTGASRPFDADRDGFVLGEGGAVLVLESRAHAEDRNVSPYAAVTGAGRTADAHHPTRPAEGGSGLCRAIERALTDAGRDPADVDHVNAHGTSTPAGDARETEAFRTVFPKAPPVTSVKGSVGHALGAAGAIESAIVARSIADGVIPPTANYETPDPDCDVPVVAETREADLEAVVTTSAGFGGTNGALVFERL